MTTTTTPSSAALRGGASTGLQLHTYQRIGTGLLRQAAELIATCLDASSAQAGRLVVHPQTDHFTYVGAIPELEPFSRWQNEASARAGWAQLLHAVQRPLDHYVQAKQVPTALQGLFNAEYFEALHWEPLYHADFPEEVRRWRVHLGVRLPSVVQHPPLHGPLAEGYTVEFWEYGIERLTYRHVPLVARNTRPLRQHLTEAGEQVREVVYQGVASGAVLPFFTTTQGLVPSTTDWATEDRPEPLPTLSDSPSLLDHTTTALTGLEGTPDDDAACLRLVHALTLRVWCVQLKYAVVQFTALLDEEAPGDSLGEVLTGALVEKVIHTLAEQFPFGGFALELSAFVVEAWNARNQPTITLQEFGTLWAEQIEVLYRLEIEQGGLYNWFVHHYRSHSEQELMRLLLDANVGGRAAGWMTEVDVQRALLAAWVGAQGGYVWAAVDVNFKSDDVVESFSTKENTKHTVEEIDRQKVVAAAITLLWPNTPLVALPFDLKFDLYEKRGSVSENGMNGVQLGVARLTELVMNNFIKTIKRNNDVWTSYWGINSYNSKELSTSQF